MFVRISTSMLFLLMAMQCIAKEYPTKVFGEPKIGAGASLEEMLQKEWPESERLIEKDGAEIKSCSGYREALGRGYFAPSHMEMGAAANRREYCSKIIWQMTVKPAKRSGIKFPVCVGNLLDEIIEGAPGNAMVSWGSAGGRRVIGETCGEYESYVHLEYSRFLVEPGEASEHGAMSGNITMNLLAQGDFDNDGWLDVIATLSAKPEFSNEGGNACCTTYARIKISTVNGHTKVTEFGDEHDGL